MSGPVRTIRHQISLASDDVSGEKYLLVFGLWNFSDLELKWQVLNVKVEAVEESDLASMEFCFDQFVSDCVHDEQRTFIGSGMGEQVEQGDSAGGGQGVDIQPVIAAADTIVEDVAPRKAAVTSNFRSLSTPIIATGRDCTMTRLQTLRDTRLLIDIRKSMLSVSLAIMSAISRAKKKVCKDDFSGKVSDMGSHGRSIGRTLSLIILCLNRFIMSRIGQDTVSLDFTLLAALKSTKMHVLDNPDVDQLMVPIHRSEDQAVLGSTSLLFTLSVSRNRVELEKSLKILRMPSVSLTRVYVLL
ncbi:hypothetical protein Tco_0733406 [Tanacetum coccineum]